MTGERQWPFQWSTGWVDSVAGLLEILHEEQTHYCVLIAEPWGVLEGFMSPSAPRKLNAIQMELKSKSVTHQSEIWFLWTVLLLWHQTVWIRSALSKHPDVRRCHEYQTIYPFADRSHGGHAFIIRCLINTKGLSVWKLCCLFVLVIFSLYW